MEPLVDISKIHVGETINVSFKESSSNFDIEDLRFIKPIEVSLDFTNTGKGIVVNGIISTSISLTCDRCLEEFEYRIRHEVDVDYHKGKEKDLLSPDLDSEGLRRAYYEGDRIDLLEEVRQGILLSIPMKPVCTEGCLGLCPHCGRNLNIERCNCEDKERDEELSKFGELLKSHGGLYGSTEKEDK